MYYKDLETSAKTKQDYNKLQRERAAERLKKNLQYRQKK